MAFSRRGANKRGGERGLLRGRTQNRERVEHPKRPLMESKVARLRPRAGELEEAVDGPKLG